MLRSFKSITGSALHAKDGKIGHSDDMLFDDEKWTIRYLVAKTGGILNRKRVLISPLGIAQVDWSGHSLKLHLTRHKIETSPDVDTDQPVFRKMEAQYFDHNGWPYYWTDTSVWGIDPRSPYIIGDQVRAKSGEEESHLHSCRKVTGYAIEAKDSGIGHVEDFLIEDDTWVLRYLVVDIKNWRHSRSMLISPQWVQSIDWSGRSIRVDLTKKMVEDSPELDPDIPVDRAYEERLHEHYQRPKYWGQIRKVG